MRKAAPISPPGITPACGGRGRTPSSPAGKTRPATSPTCSAASVRTSSPASSSPSRPCPRPRCGPDSQEICFIPDNDYARFIEDRLGKSAPGEFISPEGRPCGTHQGIIRYTVGQRKGLGIALGRPVFVRRLSPAENRVYLADAQDAYEEEILLSDLSETFPGAVRDGMEVSVKIRSRATPAKARLSREGELWRVRFAEPQRAPAPGQTAAIYDGDVVLGGGFIE